METTISLRNDHTVHALHNRRDERVVAFESHIDPTGTFEIWKDEDEREAYHNIFDESLEEYNNKQKRSDRKITNYYESVQGDKRGRKNARTGEACKHTSYEVIIAIGNIEGLKDDYGHHVRDEDGNYVTPHYVDDAVGKEIMKKYVDTWSKRNPNLYLYGIFYHVDESGVPHVHLDFIPVADGYKQGMTKQSSIGKALKQQGFEDKGKWQENSYTLWQENERKALENLCNEYGFDIVHPCVGKDITT